ncbi:MAG: hypothetical protein JST14_17300 [Bacteroidetes bacterium]|nr:hypothetical protein [Bacteroidota bacterium]
MPSLVPGYEYDIFISYRQNDNRSGWVTEFVKALQEELSAAVKDPVSVYFDVNPHDGLQETHNVDKSLEGKLKCLIFIPILSQTYCDPKSFAWQHEFCAFNSYASEDSPGRDIKLKNGNVASRILPIRIHDLEEEDKNLLEKETGSVLRAVDFIYRTAGVVRPLRRTEDDPRANLDKTFYLDQVNKVVRTIKDLLMALQKPAGQEATTVTPAKLDGVPISMRKRIAWLAAALIIAGLGSFYLFYFAGYGQKLDKGVDRSIAVLPFENMNKDPEQDYFSNGIAEDILNHLVKVSDLKVKSRTSTLQYKGTLKTIPEIGDELGVANIVEGSVRKVGDKVRIVVQLIDARSDDHLWSETYDRDLKDVLSVQSEIAMKIANALEVRLTADEKADMQNQASQNSTAYDYYLKAREFYSRGSGDRNEIENALTLTRKALQVDPSFSRAHALMADIWFTMSAFGFDEKTWVDSVKFYSDKAIFLDPSSGGAYLVLAAVQRYLGNLNEAAVAFEKAYEVDPGNPETQNAYGYYLLRKGDKRGADLVLKSIGSSYSTRDPQYYMSLSEVYSNAGDSVRVKEMARQSMALNPGSVTPHWALANLYSMQGNYAKMLNEMRQAEKINPRSAFTIDQIAWAYYRMGKYDSAAKYWSRYKEIEARFVDKSQIVPFRHRLAMTYLKLGRKKEGDALVKEDMQIQKDLLSGKRSRGTWANLGGIYYDMATDFAYLGNNDEAARYLDSALHYQFYYYEGYYRDPLFVEVRKSAKGKIFITKVDEFYNFRREAFGEALNRAEANEELKTRIR